MANAVVAAGEEEVAAAPKKGPSLIIQIAVLLALTGAAAGAGLLAAGMLKDDGAPAHAAAGGHDGKAGHDVADPAAEDAKRGNWIAIDRDRDGRISRAEFNTVLAQPAPQQAPSAAAGASSPPAPKKQE